MNRHPRIFFAGTLFALAGCSAQANPTYRGEALAVLHGTVLNSTPTSPPPLTAALVWEGWEVGQNGQFRANAVALAGAHVGSSVPVSGQFPAAFTLDVYSPPPAEALFPCAAGGHFAWASIAAVRQGADLSSLQLSDLYGLAGQASGPSQSAGPYQIFFGDADVAKCTARELEGYEGPFSPGYHLFAPLTPVEQAAQLSEWKACEADAGANGPITCLFAPEFAPTPDDLATAVSLTVSSEPLSSAQAADPEDAGVTPTPNAGLGLDAGAPSH